MASATMSSKGQVTIPAEVRHALGIHTGDRVEFVEVEPGRFEMIASIHSISELKGMINKPKRPVSIEAMNQAIAARGASAK